MYRMDRIKRMEKVRGQWRVCLILCWDKGNVMGMRRVEQIRQDYRTDSVQGIKSRVRSKF